MITDLPIKNQNSLPFNSILPQDTLENVIMEGSPLVCFINNTVNRIWMANKNNRLDMLPNDNQTGQQLTNQQVEAIGR